MASKLGLKMRVALLRGATISTHLVVLLVVQAALLAGLIGYSAVHDFTAAKERAIADATSDARLASQTLGKAISDNINQISIQAGARDLDPSTVFSDPQGCTLSGNNEDFLGSDISFVRPDGTVACTSLRKVGGVPGPGYGQLSWFPKGKAATKPFTAGPLIDPISNQYAYLIAAPFVRGGMLVASYRLDPTGRGLAQRLSLSDPTPTFLITTSDRSAVVTRSSLLPIRSLAGTSFSASLPRQGTVLRGLDGVNRIYAESPVQIAGWHVLAGITTKDAFADARRSLGDRGVLGLIMMLVVFGAGLVIQGRFARPVRSLRNAMVSVAEGDLDFRVNPDGPKEIADLAKGFNFMLAMRAKAEHQLLEAYNTEREASARLRELDDLKNSFLMAISHELRTPLTAVMGYATILKQELPEVTTETAMEYADRIDISAKRLQRLMLDLLDFERMSRGVVEPHRVPTDMRKLVDRVLTQLELERPVKVDITTGLQAEADPALLERVIENLVINAVKHTPPKANIWVRAFRLKNKVILAVEDSGRGVPKELRTEIFEPFKQGDVPSHSPGTGVGLALVSQFAKLHGGRAWVEDRTGGGASFRVTLPPVTKSSRRSEPVDEFELMVHA